MPSPVTPREAVSHIKSGHAVYVQGMAATPTVLTQAMTDHGKDKGLQDVSVYHLHTEGVCPYVEEDCQGIFRAKSLFIGANVRAATQEGRADYIPMFLSETGMCFRKGVIPLDVALVQVSPPDKHGYCSLGTSVDCTRAALQCAGTLIGQINRHMPRTYGDGIVHITNFDSVIHHDEHLHITNPKPLTPNDRLIGNLIAENLVEDGATLQMGIGNIPNAVLSALKGHKNLGIHSEMFSDGVLDLVESGVVTGAEKAYDQGKLVSTFLVGSQRLYDFVDDNPMVDMRDVTYTNNPILIGNHRKMTAINSAIEVDITGQVVSDSIGKRMYSGVGGQVDFLRGAAISERGKPILALPSRTHKGISRIVPSIKEGAGVVTTRAHVHYIVTEWGIAHLFGKSLGERAEQLISIAHPDDRDWLRSEAKKRGLQMAVSQQSPGIPSAEAAA
jgi:acyl-CoA hydrolase